MPDVIAEQGALQDAIESPSTSVSRLGAAGWMKGKVADLNAIGVTENVSRLAAAGRIMGGIYDADPLATSTFFAPLKTTLVLSRGTGNPTFTRATTAYVKDFEDVWREVPSGAARFEGARVVRNLCPTSSASVTAGNNKTITASVGVYVFSMGAGAGTITFTGTATGATGTLDADATNRTATTLIITVAGTIIATASVATCVDIQFENVTGASNQNPSEYVSVGTLSAPYHGAGVDGVEYFDYENPNTVTDNVVTDHSND